MKYKKVLLKLSGEILIGQTTAGIDPVQLDYYAHEIQKVHALGIQLTLVIGGGNFHRGTLAKNLAIDNLQSDYIGILATIMNGLALQEALNKKEVPVKHMSSISIVPICETYIKQKAIHHLEKGRVLVLSGGLGVPCFTTDSAASLRSIELAVDIMLKGTKVDGIYTKDPQKDAHTVRFDRLTFQEAYEKNLTIMDKTAFTLCESNNIPIIVFDVTKPNALRRIVEGVCIGTTVH